VTPTDNGEDKRRREGARLPDEGNLYDWYQRKADECLHFAQEATEEHTRDEWLKLANGWSQLALHLRR